MTIAQNLKAKCLPFFTLARELEQLGAQVISYEYEHDIYTLEDGSKVELDYATNTYEVL